jgi:hypothetical protein
VEKPMKNAELTGQADGSWTGENEGTLIVTSQNLKRQTCRSAGNQIYT